MTENELQKAVARLLDHSGLVWCHSPNEGLRTPRQGAHAKAMGLKSGFPDVAIFDGPFKSWGVDSHFNGLAIELKAIDAKGKRPKPTPSQLEWHDKLRTCGWRVEVCYSIDEVLELLRECYPAKFVTR
jgi:hypothetical protein